MVVNNPNENTIPLHTTNLPYLASLNLLDLNKLKNDPIQYDLNWLTVTTMLNPPIIPNFDFILELSL